MKTIAKGRQGDWFAKTRAGGEDLPCLKAEYLAANGQYHEPKFYDPSQPRNVDYVDAIKRGRVLLATYDTSQEPPKRTGYLGYIYSVEDVWHDENGLRCRIVSKQRP